MPELLGLVEKDRGEMVMRTDWRDVTIEALLGHEAVLGHEAGIAANCEYICSLSSSWFFMRW